ncbi:HlyD family efflux transporter periplasmic adaptor subunit [Flavobacterium sp.]|uniref:HlyD family secretion protein n=1 Tax=Flavobacterium sp. TaxID=239 RepID=UPI00260ECB5C|nr:HlyD family efflux transporter periplasmic adaptor subunit [Flavobacterium sp.]
MKEKDTSFELRSEEVQEILTRVPHWLIRSGSVIIFGILAMVFFASWLIEYPDIISTKIVITTNVPPQKLVAKASGRIEAILVADKTVVSKNTPLAVIENAANYKDVFLLKGIVDTFNIDRGRFPFEKLNAKQFGDLEGPFAAFQKEYIADELNSKLQPYEIDGNAQKMEAIQLKERINLLQAQKAINQSELEIQKSDLERHETLYRKGIIAAQEIEKNRLQFLQEQKNYKSLLSSISSLQSSLNELNRNTQTTKVNERKEIVNLERNVFQAFYQLKKSIKDWQINYVLTSSIDGTVSFLQIWNKNQTVVAGDQVFSIIPSKKDGYIGKVKAEAKNSGKIKIGQAVNIKLDNFPDREFGVIRGKIKAISLTPDKEGNLLIDVSLANGLLTSYNKPITFQQEMTGTADVVTEDLRLIERLLYQFRDVFRR